MPRLLQLLAASNRRVGKFASLDVMLSALIAHGSDAKPSWSRSRFASKNFVD
jgi:hypothetical protein